MIARGCYIFTLLGSYVLSVPVPADQVDKDYIKVLTCIVEVIADTLSKPPPIIISKECQDALTGDDRIVSILRHQTLLKELQEIASQGISEGEHQIPQKKNGADSNQVTEALGGHSSMEDTREQSRSRSGSSENGDSAERGNEVEQESRESTAESREGNEIGGTNEGGVVEETKEEKERGMKEKDEENSKEHHISSSVEKEKGERKEPGESHSFSSEEESKGKEENETEEDNSSQESKDGERQKLKSDSESHEEHSREEKPDRSSSMSISESESSEKNFKREAEEEEMEGKPEKKRNEDGQVAVGSRIKMERRQGSPRLLRYTPQHSKEKSGEEGVVRRSPEAQELHMMARGEMEEKRGEEEGSASHRGEENEIARLAAIELELESVAQRLHELRRA